MANPQKISELPAAGPLTGVELVPIVQNSGTLRTTVSAVGIFATSALSNDVAGVSLRLDTVAADVSVNAAQIAVVSALTSVNAAAITSINAVVSTKVNRVGDFMTEVQYIDFDTSGSTAPTTAGELTWNLNDGTLDVGLYNGVTLQVGQETLFYIKNGAAVSIAAGQLVMATSALGASGKIIGAPAIADGTISPEYFLGVAAQTIAPNDFGYVADFGLVRGFNSSGAPYGETWVDGQILYANASVTGGLTNSAPAFPGFSTPVAIVINAATGGSGSIFVRMKTGEYLRQLHDVDLVSVSNNDIIIYDTSLSAWTNSPALTVAQASISALNIQLAAVSASVSVLNVQMLAVQASISAINSALAAIDVSALAALEPRVSALEIRVANVSASVSALQVQLNDVSAAVSINAAAITSVNAVVSALDAKISDVSAAVVSVGSALTSTNNVVSALEIRVSAASATGVINAAAISSVNNVVSALEIRVSAASATGVTNAAAITSINNVVSALEVRVSTVEAALSAIGDVSAIAALVSVVALLDAEVSALEVRVSAISATGVANAAAITSINNVVSALEIRVSAASATGVTNAAAITSINNVVSTLEIRVSAVSAAGTTNAAAITSVNDVVSALEIRVSTVSAAVSVNTVAINAVSAAVSLRVLRAGDTMTGALTITTSADQQGLTVDGRATFNAVASISAGFYTGLQNYQDNTLQRATFRDYALVLVARGSVSATATLDLTDGNFFQARAAGSTTFVFANPPVSAIGSGAAAGGFILELQNGGAATVTWPSTVRWPGGVSPSLTASGFDVLTFVTDDGGTNWRGVMSMKDSK